MIFSAILKPIIKFPYWDGKCNCVFLAIHKTAFSQRIKIHKLTCCHLSWHCTEPRALDSAQVGCWVMGALTGLGWAGLLGRKSHCCGGVGHGGWLQGDLCRATGCMWLVYHVPKVHQNTKISFFSCSFSSGNMVFHLKLYLVSSKYNSKRSAGRLTWDIN